MMEYPLQAPFLRLAAMALGLLTIGAANAGGIFYGLQPQQVADGVYIFEGRQEHFTRRNGGNIVNTGFVITSAGVVVLDTGPSRAYGEEMRRAIAQVTDQPIHSVYLTHHHPDHFLGNQAFEDVPICALPYTREMIERDGEALLDNMYNLLSGWMGGTYVVAPDCTAEPGPVTVGERTLEVIAGAGHSGPEASDLMLHDQRSDTLFAGDLVFYDRAPTTPHADLSRWVALLHELERELPRTLVPGHGPVTRDVEAVLQTRDYVEWLASALREAAEQGLDMAEALELEVPERFRHLAVVDEELRRSVAHLYPGYETQALNQVIDGLQ
ncbi:quinoprotein relay system zinc metallohydrolase 1 [Alkalilimnicola ehrlichii MLHE-1]|uniref:Beta-lactamase domain protein n=1 Tax=Alkalilimnicola ehrlichii (strain ATCC BAA-1101 / DSM 17681 / MLHE-1) TaxID=187272 RepID=Q0A514_ALKEH|nr:quinoprotein relay system zinc metallohydrolase 1 [Alkalilimnicola ehrlichii]ABI58073.1 beta-lactamase domain protein [Alkalilimnicola ehrlichii MLHE-1]